MSKTSLLIRESPMVFQPSLAKMVGLNEAIVVQQLHYLLNIPRFGVELNGHHWIFKTYEQWQSEHLPFWSISTIKRVFARLEEMHLVESCQPDGGDRRKYYRLNTGMVEVLTFENLPPEPSSQNELMPPSGQNEPFERVKMSRSYNRTETTTKTSSVCVEDEIVFAFGDFWAAYPKKVKKKDAEKAFRKAKLHDRIDDILAALERHKASDQWKRGFIPDPTRWINGELWNDILASAPPQANGKPAKKKFPTAAERRAEIERRGY